MTSPDALSTAFTARMLNDLATNNVLRGSWAEQIVAHYLDITDLPPNWTYYDMCLANGAKVSVKHSVGTKAKFSVGRSEWAWDSDPSAPGAGQWLHNESGQPHYWCDIYIFAWLDAETSTPPLDDVVNPELWQFAALSRDDMHKRFVDDRPEPQKTAGLSRLKALASFVPGADLARVVEDLDVSPVDVVEDATPIEAAYGAAPTVTVGEPVPESVADLTDS